MNRHIEFQNAHGGKGFIFLDPGLIEAVLESEDKNMAGQEYCELRTTTGHQYYVKGDAGEVLEKIEKALLPATGIVDVEAAENAIKVILLAHEVLSGYFSDDDQSDLAVKIRTAAGWAHKAFGSTMKGA